jgi:hypothetical protein
MLMVPYINGAFAPGTHALFLFLFTAPWGERLLCAGWCPWIVLIGIHWVAGAAAPAHGTAGHSIVSGCKGNEVPPDAVQYSVLW